MVAYVGLEDVVECGVVVGGELTNFSFVRVSRLSGLLRSSGLRRTSDLFRTTGTPNPNRIYGFPTFRDVRPPGHPTFPDVGNL